MAMSRFLISFCCIALMLSSISLVAAQTPVIDSIQPSMNALNIHETSSITVFFDVPMDESTINEASFRVDGTQSGRHSGTISYDEESYSASFDPLGVFARGEIVTAVLTAEIMSSQGTPIAAGYVWSFTIGSESAPATFLPAVDYAVGDHPWCVEAADFDNDGYVDLAVSGYYSNDVSILMNNGDGTFSAASSHAVSFLPRDIAASDLNGDGFTDLAVGSGGYRNGRISILLGDGAGDFASATSFYSADRPVQIVAGDLDADGAMDLVSVSQDSEMGADNRIYMNDGNASFTGHGIYYFVGSFVTACCIADIDNDADLDLSACSQWNGAFAYLNTGAAEFGYSTLASVADDPYFIAVSDVDSDGDIDFAVVNQASDNVSLLLNSGDGSISTQTTYQTPSGPYAVRFTDLDGDGDQDMIIANKGANSVSMLFNFGNGSFGNRVDYNVGSNPKSVCAADFDGDGDIDLAVANASSDNVSILLNEVDQSSFVMGDADNSGAVDIDDVVYLIGFIFSGGNPPVPLEAGDADGSGDVDIDDVVYLIAYIFAGGLPPGANPHTEMLANSTCKYIDWKQPDDSITSDQECYLWDYNGSSSVSMIHVNAGFNCGAEVDGNISVAGDTILIEEIEILGDYSCLCLFDVDYELMGVAPGQYTVKVIHVDHLWAVDEVLIFDVDFVTSPEGDYCVTRSYYPWGAY